MRLRAIAAALLACATARPVDAGPVRMFAVGHKQRLDDGVSYQAFHDKMAALMDATFPGRSTLVQAGVDDVATHLAPADPTAPAQALVVFPEDTGLIASFIGTRGAGARTQSTAAGAIASLLAPYAPQSAYYDGKFPGQPLVRRLVLALTDTFYRSVYETFRELATTHGVYLAVSANCAPARRVEAVAEPELVALLRDPDEPGRTYAYEAVSPLPRNTTFVFAPNGEILVPDGHGGTLEAPSQTGGELRGSTDKAYLVPIEQPPPGTPLGLALSFGAVRDMEVLDTPVGRLAIVISKDAWMVDVNDRFAAKGANVVLQPEAFDSWAFVTSEWSPDVFKEGGYANLQKTPEWVVNVDASMTGNLLDTTFDGQSAILGRKQKTPAGPLSGANAWIGQNPDTGFRALAPWVVPDPGIADPGLGLAARRDALAAVGTLLRPGSGVACADSLAVGACENGYREAVVWADVDVPTTAETGPSDPVLAAPPAFGNAVRVSGPEATRVVQRAPSIAARGRHVYVAWEEVDGASHTIYLTASHDRGRSYRLPPVKVSDHAVGAVTELNPAVAVKGGRVVVAWQEFVTPGDDDDGRIQLARFSASLRKRGPDVRVDDHDGSGKWMPAVAFAGARPVVTWIDERDLGPEGEPLEHVYAARGLSGGIAFEPSTRVDSGTPVDLALHVDNKWAPTIATNRSHVWIAWADFREYNWDVFVAHSTNAGASFGANVRVDDYPDFERIDERPTLAVDRDGSVHVAWTDLRAREADTNVFYAKSTTLGQSFGPNVQVDDSRMGFDADTATPTNQWHPSIAVDNGHVFVAWQDNRLGNDDVFFTTSVNAGASFGSSERVDDTGAGSSEQTRPRLAIAGHGARRMCYVAWEDTRKGDRDIYAAARACGN